MDEYIKREDVLQTLKKANIGGYITERLLEIPSADVQTVKHGEWEKKKSYLVCSNCGMTVDTIGYTYEEQEEVFHYCSCCGARMDGKEATLIERCSNYNDCYGSCFIDDTPCDCGGNIEKCKGR